MRTLEWDILSVYPYQEENIQEMLCRLYSMLEELKKNGEIFDIKEYEAKIQELTNKIEEVKSKIPSIVSLEQLGAKGDGITDDLEAFNKAKLLLDKGAIKKVVGNGHYAVSNTIQLSSKNEIEYDLGVIKPMLSFPTNGSIVKAGDDNGSQSGLIFKAISIDARKDEQDKVGQQVTGLNITSTGGSTFDIGSIIACKNAGIRIDNPTQISSDNLLKGNVIRQCGFGIILRSETESRCEGTMIKYNFIYDNMFAGILLGKGSHYSDIHSMTDFNGKYTVLLEIEGSNCWRRDDEVEINGDSLIVVEAFENMVYLRSKVNCELIKKDYNRQQITCREGRRSTVTKTISCNTDGNRQEYLDIINANTKAGFSKNTIITTYCGGIYGSRLSMCTDFMVFGKSSQNEGNVIGGLTTRMNANTIDILDVYENKMILQYSHEYMHNPKAKPNKGLNINGSKVFSRIVGNVLNTSTPTPVASYKGDNLESGTYLVNITPIERQSEYNFVGLLFWDKEKNKSTLHKIKEHNIAVKENETGEFLKAQCNLALEVRTTFLKIG